MIVYVRAEPIYNVTSLACLVHDVVIPANYYQDDVSGEDFITCRLSSIQYFLVESLIGFPIDREFSIEVSLNGHNFSSNEQQFKYIYNN